MVTANLFLDKEFDIFVKNGIFGKYIGVKFYKDIFRYLRQFYIIY